MFWQNIAKLKIKTSLKEWTGVSADRIGLQAYNQDLHFAQVLDQIKLQK